MADEPGPLPAGLEPVGAPKAAPGPLPQGLTPVDAPNTGRAGQFAAPSGSLPEAPPSASAGLLRSWKENELAAIQGVNPHATSKYFPSSPENKPTRRGALEQYDWGPAYRSPEGKVMAFDPQTDFIAMDPETNQPTVYGRTAQTDENRAVSLSRYVAPMLGTGPMIGPARVAGEAPAAATLANPTSRATQAANEITRDIQAFNRMDVPTPPIAFMGGPTSGAAKMLSKIPFIGAPIDNSIEGAYAGTSEAVRNLSGRMGPNATMEQTGALVQSGLDRARNARMQDLEPHILTDMGIEPRAPVQNRALMSNAAAERADEAQAIRESLNGGTAQTNRGVEVPAARPLNETYQARRGVQDLSDTELQRVVSTPAPETSFGTRSEALYEKAWRSVPTFFRADGRANSTRLATPNTRAALDRIDANITNSIAGQGTINGELAGRLTNPRAHFSLDDLRAIRTEVGRSLSNFSPFQQSLDRSQLNSLYRGLSQDIEVSLQDIANRAYRQTQVSNNRPDYIAPDVARRADQALRDFRVADRYFRQGIERMDRFSKVAGTENPQQAIGYLINAATDGQKGNERLLRAAMSNLRPEERNQIGALLVTEMGKPVPSAGGVVEKYGFSPQSFMTRWNKMSPQSRDLLFGGDYAREMDDLVRVVRRISNVEKQANTSKSGTDIVNFLTGIGSVGMAMNGHTALLASMAAPMAGASVLFSRPGYVHWIAQYARARAALLDASATARAPRITALVNQLGQLAQKDSALIPIYRQVAAENGIGQRSEEQNRINH